MLNKSGESGHPCLFPDLRGIAFNFSPLSMILAMGLSYMSLIMLRYVPSISAFLRVFFFNKWMLNFVKCFFSASIESYDHMVFTLYFVGVVYHID